MRLAMQKNFENVGISGAVARSVDSATDKVHRAIDTVSEKTHPAVDSVTSGAHSATNSVAGAANHAATAIDEKSELFLEAQERLMDNCRSFVQEKPLAALGLALGAGFILNWWLRKA